MTSSIPAPRIDFGLFSPIVQRSASSKLDLPQPLGPTTPVSPGSMRRSAASTKLLNPDSLSRLICILSAAPRHVQPSGAPCLEHGFQRRPVADIVELFAID